MTFLGFVYKLFEIIFNIGGYISVGSFLLALICLVCKLIWIGIKALDKAVTKDNNKHTEDK